VPNIQLFILVKKRWRIQKETERMAKTNRVSEPLLKRHNNSTSGNINIAERFFTDVLHLSSLALLFLLLAFLSQPPERQKSSQLGDAPWRGSEGGCSVCPTRTLDGRPALEHASKHIPHCQHARTHALTHTHSNNPASSTQTLTHRHTHTVPLTHACSNTHTQTRLASPLNYTHTHNLSTCTQT